MLHFVSEINILAITLTENVGVIFCYGDEENARIYAVHLTTSDQSEIRRAYLVSVCLFQGYFANPCTSISRI